MEGFQSLYQNYRVIEIPLQLIHKTKRVGVVEEYKLNLLI